jgi:periplasmic protein TonB
VKTVRIAGLALLAACGADSSTPGVGSGGGATTPGLETPVATNAESPVAYPADLYAQRIEGTVVLRLFADEDGRIVPDSTQLAEGSGYLALDSAALQGVARMRFAPAQRNGVPIATSFLQPVHFRHPERASSGDGS